MKKQWLAWACMALVGATATARAADDGIYHINHRGFQIPIDVKAGRQGEIRELRLWISRNEGKSWEIAAKATPDRKAFDFNATGDGLLYFSIAVVDGAGRQEPSFIESAPVGQKIYIDTVKPVAKITSAERVGGEVRVAWQVREDYPDWTTLRLEYKMSDAPNNGWTPLPVQGGVTGNYNIPGVSPNAEVTVRLSVSDMAKNHASDERTVAASPTPAERTDAGLRRTSMDTVPPPPAPVPGGGGALLPPPAPAPAPAPGPGTLTPIADTTPAPMPAPAPAPFTGTTTSHSTTPPPAMPSQEKHAQVKILNRKQLELKFDVERCGPSGIGGVDVYSTTNDGATWELMKPGDVTANLPNPVDTLGGTGGAKATGSVTINVLEENKVTGFYLVLKSGVERAKGKPEPRTKPQVRVEVDVTKPESKLFEPAPDPHKPDCLLLQWVATDRNLAANPVSLEWASRPEGPWNFIGDAQLPNTGSYSWKVVGSGVQNPPPPKVYLKLTVRDQAGNDAVAQTSKPVTIDLIVPEIGGVAIKP